MNYHPDYIFGGSKLSKSLFTEHVSEEKSTGGDRGSPSIQYC